MPSASIFHRSMTRPARDQEISADSTALTRIRQMFPTQDDLMSLSPEHARTQIETWNPFLEAGIGCCDTLPGVEAVSAVMDMLAELQRTPSTSNIRARIAEAFRRLDETAASLHSALPMSA